ncbi:MAG: ribosomal-processing cysteine protease Prp, partial [Bacillota bacterium]
MTRIVVRREGERISALKAQGHAGDDAAGGNIVCAAVSSLMHTAVNALESVAGIVPVIGRDDRKALLSVTLPEICESHDAQV